MAFCIEDIVKAWNDTQTLYYKEIAEINQDGTLSEVGKREAKDALVDKMRCIWLSLEAQYRTKAEEICKTIDGHYGVKPKNQPPTEDEMREQMWAFNGILARLALTQTPDRFLEVLVDVQANGTPAEKKSLINNYAQVMLVSRERLEKATPSDTADNRTQAEYDGLVAKVNTRLRNIFEATQNQIKDERVCKWEARLNELRDNLDTMTGAYKMGLRLFTKNFESVFGLQLVPTDKGADPWAPQPQDDKETPWDKLVSSFGTNTF